MKQNRAALSSRGQQTAVVDLNVKQHPPPLISRTWSGGGLVVSFLSLIFVSTGFLIHSCVLLHMHNAVHVTGTDPNPPQNTRHADMQKGYVKMCT